MRKEPTHKELLEDIAKLKKKLTDLENTKSPYYLEKQIIAQKAIIDSTTDLIWSVDSENFGLLTYNQALYNYFLEERGIKIKIGDRPDYLLPTIESANIWKNLYKATLENGSLKQEYLVYNKTRILELNLNVLKHNNEIFGISVFGKDITAQKQAEKDIILAKEAAIESEKQQQALLNNSINPITITTYNGRVIYLNKSAIKFFGLDENFDFTTLNPHDFWLHPEKRKIFSEQIKEKGYAINFENEFITGEKTIKTVLINCSSINYHGENVMFSIYNDITEKRKLENSLIAANEKTEEREKQLQALFDNVSEGIGISINGISYLVNNAYVEMFGYKNADEIIGKSLLKQISPKEHEKLKYYISNRYTDPSLPKYYESVGVKANGEEFPIEIHVGVYKINNTNYSFGILRDITQRKQIKQELINAKEKAEEKEKKISEQKNEIEFNNERLESLLRISQYQTESVQELLDFALDEAVKLTGSKIGYIYFYKENTKQFILNTWSKDVMKECSVVNPQTVYHLDKTGCWGEAVRQRKPIVINNYKAENQYKKGLPEGHVSLNNFLTIPVMFDNKIVAVAGVANKKTDYDNSDIRQLTLLMDNVWKISERILLIDNLKSAKEKAEESDRLKSSFLNNMSHEIRTPLNAIVGFSELIAKPDQKIEKLIKYSEMISISSNKLKEIITDVIEISQIQSKITQPILTTFDFIPFISSIFDSFKIKAQEKNLKFQTRVNISSKKFLILSDDEKLKRILIHLIDNALKFTLKGKVDIVCSFENDNLKFEIKDTGVGISEDMQTIIFEPFRQVETGNCRNFGGNGLGLSLAKAYTELLNGSITLKSEINKGTTFYVTVPIKKAELESKTLTVEKKKNNKENTLLIVEDEYNNYQYLLALFEEKKFKIIYAENGQKAVDICHSNKTIDLILMDIKMPVMDGHAAAKLIKKFRPDIPIIAQTAYALEYEREKFIDFFDDYVTKPISEELLNQKMDKYLK